MRVARLLDRPEGSDSAEHPERDELRFRDVIEALHRLFGRDDQHMEKADDGAREAGPEGIYLESSIDLLMGSVFLGAVTCHMVSRISRLAQRFDNKLHEGYEEPHDAREEGVLPQAPAPGIILVAVERLGDETLLAVVESHTALLSRP